MDESKKLGTRPISSLLWSQSVPSAIGILMLSVYSIVDSIYVGQFVGSLGLGAIAVVLPITFFISALGMAIGVGGGSIISRALGANNPSKAHYTFGNQTILTLFLSLGLVIFSSFFPTKILTLFGGQGELLAPSLEYFKVLLPSVPFLAWSMMSNNVFRAEGMPKIAMITMLIPAFLNLLLDPIFIVALGWGLKGAALATSLSYIAAGIFTFLYFLFGNSQMSLQPKYLGLQWNIVVEIIKIGGVTFVRQAIVSILSIILNNTLFVYGAELAVSAYGIISRLMMFINFPVFGLTQGFLPIAGYNYGAKYYNRVQEALLSAVKYGLIIAFVIFLGIMIFSKNIVQIFTNEASLITLSTPALRFVFLMSPFLIIQLITSAYYQAIGKAFPALFMALLRQGIFLVPLVLILPNFLGLDGVWFAFPLADFLATLVSLVFLAMSYKKLGEMQKAASQHPTYVSKEPST